MDEAPNPFVISDEVFTIVAHPLRRKILQAIFENETITFTTLSIEWKLVTGTIYHHLKILGSLVYKDELNVYHLTDEGHKVCEWFLNTKSGRTTVKKIDSFTLLTRSFENLIDNNFRLILVTGIFFSIFGIFAATSIEVKILGSFIFPSFNRVKFQELFIWNLLSLIGMMLFLLGISWISKKSQTLYIKELVARFLISLFPSNAMVVIIYLLNLIYTVQLNMNYWVIISFINQLVFLFVLSSTMIHVNGLSVERSALYTLGNLYFQFYIVFLLI